MRSSSALWFPIILALILQGLFVVRGVVPVTEGGLYGPDSYMRLVRVGELVDSGQWSGQVSTRSNAPFGEELHWTRPLDALLVIGALPLSLFLGFERALHLWGVLIGPALQLAALAAMFWAAAPLFEVRGRMFLAVIFLGQPGVFNVFMVGRPDHHGLLALLFIVSLGLTLRLIRAAPRRAESIAAGTVLGLAVWVSVESLLPVALLLAALALSWLWEGGDLAERSLAATLSLTAASGLALVVDPPGGGWLAPVYDRLSVVHVSLFAALFLFWLAISRPAVAAVVTGGAGRRMAVGGLGLVAVVGFAWLAFPKFLGGPYVDVDPEVLPIYLDLVEEVQPLRFEGAAPFKDLLYWLGAAFLGVPYLLYRCARRDEARRLWIYLAGATLICVALTFYQLRWATYAGLVLAFPVTGLLMEALGVFDRHFAQPWRVLARSATVILFCVGFLVVGGNLKRSDQEAARTGAGSAARCSLKDFAAFANGPAGEGGRQRILASAFSGPEILYRTRHEVVSTPYHRNAAGLGDAHAILSAVDEEVARAGVLRRGVTWLLLCPDSPERALYESSEAGPTLYDRLARGEAPEWLHAVDLPTRLAGFRLFDVAR